MFGVYWVYILANKRNGTLYVGVTNDIIRRIAEHRSGAMDGFTKKYGVSRLVWCEQFPNVLPAIQTEKRVKKWNRAWKTRLIEKGNPEWCDLSNTL